MKNKCAYPRPLKTIVFSLTTQKFETENCNIYCHIMVTKNKKLKIYPARTLFH